jgi:hypothetical protein
MNDVTSTSYLYCHSLDNFKFEGDALVELYDPHCKPSVTIESVYINGTKFPYGFVSDWIIDKLEQHVLTQWQLEQWRKAK